MTQHCADIEFDRKVGEWAEEEFCRIAASHGKYFTDNQIGRAKAARAISWSAGAYAHLLLPDVTLWSKPGEHHEIKQKTPTNDGCFGLEKYRFESLVLFQQVSGQQVHYSILDHSRIGGKCARRTTIDDWITAPISGLADLIASGAARCRLGATWIGGVKKSGVPIYYWPVGAWQPLAALWKAPGAPHLSVTPKMNGHAPLDDLRWRGTIIARTERLVSSNPDFPWSPDEIENARRVIAENVRGEAA